MKTRMFLPLVVVLSVAAALPTGCRSTPGWRTISPGPLDGQGLHEVFLKARAIMEQPYIPGGEDSEGVSFRLRDQWIFVGDERFAEALAKEKPDVFAAVGHFVSKPWMGRRTEELIANAGKIDFPASRAVETDRQR
ncbi:MAG: hypothetical protein ACKOB0_04765 [Chthoniobacterales bacterium]